MTGVSHVPRLFPVFSMQHKKPGHRRNEPGKNLKASGVTMTQGHKLQNALHGIKESLFGSSATGNRISAINCSFQ